MMGNDENQGAGSGAITGLVLAAAAQWSRQDDDTQNRIRSLRHDARDALAQIRELTSRGEVIRGRLPTVMDALTGLALANPLSPSANVLPTNVPMTRPQLVQSEGDGPQLTAIEYLSWPPKPGVYDEQGLVRESGDLTTLFLALTYEEVRAALQGLVQDRQPSRSAKGQIFFATNSLVSVLCQLNLTWAQYVDVWRRLFSGSAASPTDSHVDAGKPPMIQGMNAGLQSVTPLGQPDLPLQYRHQNTDTAHKYRITVAGGGNIAAGTTLFSVVFATPYTKNGVPYAPTVVTGNTASLLTSVASPTGYTVSANVGLSAGAVVDAAFAVVAG